MNVLRPRYEYCDRLYPAGYIETSYEDCSLAASSTSAGSLSAQCVYQASYVMVSIPSSSYSLSRVRSVSILLTSSVVDTLYYSVLRNIVLNITTSLVSVFMLLITYSLSVSSSAIGVLASSCKRVCSLLCALVSQLQLSATADILKALRALISSLSSTTLQVSVLRGLSFLSSSVSSISYRLSGTINFIMTETALLSTAFRVTLVTVISLILSQASQWASAFVITKPLRIIESLYSSVSYNISTIIRTLRQVFVPTSTVRFTQTIIYRLTTSISSMTISFIHVCRTMVATIASQTASYLYIVLFAWREKLVYASRIVLTLWNKSPITTVLKKSSKVGRLYGRDV